MGTSQSSPDAQPRLSPCPTSTVSCYFMLLLWPWVEERSQEHNSRLDPGVRLNVISRSRWERIHPSLQQLQELLQTKSPSPFRAYVPLSSVLKSCVLATSHGCWPGCPRVCEPNEKAAEKKEMAHCVPKMRMCDEILEEHHQRRVIDYCRESKGLASYCFQIIAETKKGLCRHAHTHMCTYPHACTHTKYSDPMEMMWQKPYMSPDTYLDL